ncbi:MAG: hypothetical protein NC344_10575 [Bacteroidales bacterium]|nr:hypothetical protein [Bacteroidales bacterium]MCM1148249.1 hypothetical protein [Bacteroidales bacterium]MCM1206572.1 hypothetical protein [Bacillota bacterium]MCM1510526.1 hypothetical protein [Clostridium sp.]
MNQTTEIIFDNLFILLRRKAFGSEEETLPMSQWKWKQAERLMKKAEEDPEPYSGAETYHFISQFQEKKRDMIWREEPHTIDTSTETLELLNLIIYNINHIERLGFSVHGIILIGQYLRRRGDRVDFVKLDNWINKLHIRRMTSLIGSILTEIFNFDDDEVPFLYKKYKKARILLCTQLHNGTSTGFVHKTGSLLRYSPFGAVGYWGQLTKKALDSIEE